MKKLLLSVLLLVLVAGGVAGYVAYGFYRAAAEPYQGYSASEPQLIAIPPGSGPQAIGQRLIAAGVIKDRWVYRVALWRSGEARRLQAGEYRFDKPLSPLDVIGKIARGEVDLLPVTFPEGLNIREMARLFESAGFGQADEFVAAASSPVLIQAIDPAATDLEGYLFPETYSLSRHTTAAALVNAMVERFLKIATPELREAAKARNLTVRQWVTLASIVEKETARPDERPVVASVYANRLRIGMPLQCDPTVIYALTRAGRYNGNIRRDDLQFDSPYNTYRSAGLPPGPIASPGAQAIRATLFPAASPYLYFVSKNDGTHQFSATLVEHNKAVEKYQKQYFSRAHRGKT